MTEININSIANTDHNVVDLLNDKFVALYTAFRAIYHNMIEDTGDEKDIIAWAAANSFDDFEETLKNYMKSKGDQLC